MDPSSNYAHGFSYWSNCEDLQYNPSVTKTLVPPLAGDLKRMDRIYIENIEESVVKSLRSYLDFLLKKQRETNATHTNSVTEQASLEDYQSYLRPRIEKTKALITLIES